MKKKNAKIPPEKIKPQDRPTKLKVKKSAESAYKSMQAAMGNFDDQWRESERNNSNHASKQNLEKFANLADKEFMAARKAKPDMEKYKVSYNKYQQRKETIRRMMNRLEKKLDEQSFLAHMPRRYLDKFPGVKQDPQKAAQYVRERGRKADVAKHYIPSLKNIIPRMKPH